MAKNDFSLLYPVDSNLPPTHIYPVAAGTTSSINAGEFVLKALGTVASGKAAKAFTASQSLQPSTGTDYIVGLAMSTSTETTTATGYVEVMEMSPNLVFIGNPDVVATWGQTTGSQSQTTYNNLVGSRVLIKVTAGVHTLLAADNVNNGLVVEYLDVTQFPGKAAFSLRAGNLYKA
jgi:hypothetical protein